MKTWLIEMSDAWKPGFSNTRLIPFENAKRVKEVKFSDALKMSYPKVKRVKLFYIMPKGRK